MFSFTPLLFKGVELIKVHQVKKTKSECFKDNNTNNTNLCLPRSKYLFPVYNFEKMKYKIRKGDLFSAVDGFHRTLLWVSQSLQLTSTHLFVAVPVFPYFQVYLRATLLIYLVPCSYLILQLCM